MSLFSLCRGLMSWGIFICMDIIFWHCAPRTWNNNPLYIRKISLFLLIMLLKIQSRSSFRHSWKVLIYWPRNEVKTFSEHEFVVNDSKFSFKIWLSVKSLSKIVQTWRVAYKKQLMLWNEKFWVEWKFSFHHFLFARMQ